MIMFVFWGQSPFGMFESWFGTICSPDVIYSVCLCVSVTWLLSGSHSTLGSFWQHFVCLYPGVLLWWNMACISTVQHFSILFVPLGSDYHVSGTKMFFFVLFCESLCLFRKIDFAKVLTILFSFPPSSLVFWCPLWSSWSWGTLLFNVSAFTWCLWSRREVRANFSFPGEVEQWK